MFDQAHRLVVVLSLMAAGWALGSGTARADKLDDALLRKEAREIQAKLMKARVKAVGILPFRVIKGNHPESFLAGPVCSDMTTRLENTLIMIENPDEKKALGVIHDAAGAAARHKIGAWFKKPAEQKKLFDHSYPLAWGKESVKPDAFLTGVISNTGNTDEQRMKTKVVIEAIYRTSPEKREKLHEFEIETDRVLLGEMGYNFTLARGAKGRSSIERDRMAISLVRRRDANQPPPDGGQVAVSTPENVGGFGVGVLYNNNPTAIRPVSQGGGTNEYYVPPVTAGTQFGLTLTYNGQRSDNLGVIVKVNGESTWKQEKGDSINLAKWLYSSEKHRGKADLYNGYYTDVTGKNLKPFRVLTADESASREAEFGERVGWIDIDVFATGTRENNDEKKLVSARGAARGPKPNSLAEAQSQLYKANHVRRAPPAARPKGAPRDVAGSQEGGLIVPDEAVQGLQIGFGSLPNPILIGSLRIKYYDPSRKTVSP